MSKRSRLRKFDYDQHQSRWAGRFSDQLDGEQKHVAKTGSMMALALVITLQKELPDATALYTKAKTGKALARESERLSTAARRCNVPALTSMLSESQAALIAQLEADGFDPSKMRIPPEQWFPAAEGLKTVRGLFDQVTANLNDFKQPNPILRDLKAAEALLVAAESAQIAFHFSNADL